LKLDQKNIFRPNENKKKTTNKETAPQKKKIFKKRVGLLWSEQIF
jgi:hypothetical protein